MELVSYVLVLVYLSASTDDLLPGHDCLSDLRNVCTEAGMFAIRDDRDFVTQDGAFLFGLCSPSLLLDQTADWLGSCLSIDFMKGARKLQEAKKHETSSDYEAV